MILATGSWVLRTACVVALAMPVVAIAAGHPDWRQWRRFCHPAALALAILLAIAQASLTIAFVTHEFSSAYVAANSHTSLPLAYRLTASWGEHEGSLLLWLCLLGAWIAAVAQHGRALPSAMLAAMLGVLGLVAAVFGTFITVTADPFGELLPAPVNGGGLNPLLQNPAMALHPPLLYAGYAGSAVPFAFAIAALVTGRTDRDCFRWLRPLATVGWLLLTLGITVGSYWSYAELGWGGWWFWDPVENAALMAWLIATATVHSIAVASRRGLFVNWTMLLSIAGFSLSLLGTFLTRAGLVASVHSFATAPERGRLLLTGFGMLIAGALAIYGLRAKRPATRVAPGSRESFLLLNHILLTATAAIVFVGTFYPAFVRAFALTDVSVGAPWYETVLLLPTVPLLLSICLGMHAAWGSSQLRRLIVRLRWPAALALLAGAVAAAAVSPVAGLGILAGLAIVGSALTRAGPDSIMRSLAMRVAHGGIGILVIGITVSGSSGLQVDRVLRENAPPRLGDYSFRLVDTRTGDGPNYRAAQASIEVRSANTFVATLTPEKRHYPARNAVLSEVAIDSNWRRDLIVALGQDLGQDTYSVRLQYRPLIRLVWVGGLLMAGGALIAVVHRRRRP